MSTNKTKNLKLHSWVGSDPIIRDEFNDNFKLIDDGFQSMDEKIASAAGGAPRGAYLTLALLQSAFPTGDSHNYIVTGAVREVDTLTITAVPTASGNVTVTLNGVTFNIALSTSTETTVNAVATKIRNTVFAGWTTGGTGAVVTFTADAEAAKSAPSYSAGSTGATGTMVVTTTGLNPDGKWYFWNGTAWTAGAIYQPLSLKTGSVSADKTDFLVRSKNLFNITSITSGLFIDWNGNASTDPVVNSAYNTSDYIPVLAGKTYTISLARAYSLYNTNKTWISGVNGGSSVVTTFVAAQDGYLRFSYPVGTTNVQVEEGPTTTAYETYGIIKFPMLDGGSMRDQSITNTKYGLQSIETTHVKDKNITTGKIADSGVETINIKDKNVTGAKVASKTLEGRSIKEKEIASYHTTFMDIGKNMFNKDSVQNSLGYYPDHLSGNLTVNAGYNASHYIPVKAGTTYAISAARKVAVYNTDMVVVPAQGMDINPAAASTITPAQDGYIRVAFATGTSWTNGQVEQGSVQTTYAAYVRKIPNLEIPDSAVTTTKVADKGITNLKLGDGSVDGRTIKQGEVSYYHTTFIEVGKNLFNKSDSGVSLGYYIDHATGTFQASASYNTSNFIPVKSGVTYAVSKCRKVIVYDAQKTFIAAQSIDIVNGITTVTPLQEGFIRVSFNVVNDWALGQVEVGSVQTAYEPYIRKVKDIQVDGAAIKTKSIDASHIKDDVITATQVDFVNLGKNLFNSATRTVDYFIANNTGTLSNSPTTYDTSDYIPVKSGITYAISKCRKVLAYDNNNVVISSSYQDVSMVPTTITPTQDGYIRVSFAKTDLATAQVEQGSTQTTFEPYGLKLTTSVGLQNKSVKSANVDDKAIQVAHLSDEVEQLMSSASGLNTLTVVNADKIGFIADSYTEGLYAVKGKNYINKLSLFSDYNYENFAQGGDTYRGNLDRLRKKQGKFHPTLSWQDFKPKYAVLAAGTNDSAYMTLEQFGNDLRAVLETVQGLGAIPIISTVHHTASLGSGVINLYRQIAQEYDIDFMDILPPVYRTQGTSYAPFWVGGHAGTRANALLSDNMEKYLSKLPRPRQSLKIFRKRDSVAVSSMDDLIFSNNLERAKKFREIHVGHTALVDPKNVDDVNNKTIANVTSEYLKIQNSENVAFNDYALVSAILPSTALGLSSLALEISDTTAEVYVKDVVATPYPSPTFYQSFEMADPSVFNVGDKYTSADPVFAGLTFTVTQVKSDRVIMSPYKSGTNNPGTLTKTSGIGPATVNYDYTSVGFADDYPVGKQNIGHWVKLSLVNGKFEVPYNLIKSCVDYDKASFLIKKAGAFNLNKVEVEWSGKEDKVYRSRPLKTAEPTGTELLAQTKMGNSTELSGWTIDGTIATPFVPADNNLPRDTTGCIEITTANKISQSITNPSLNEEVEVEVRAIARYFPTINDPAGSTFTITEDTYDYADLAMDITTGTDAAHIHTMTDRINTHWKEVSFRISIPHACTSMKFKFYSKDKTIQIAKVSVKKV